MTDPHGKAQAEQQDVQTGGSAAPDAAGTFLAGAEVHVTDRQGRAQQRPLSAREQWLAARADAALREARALPTGAALVRAEVNGLVPDTDTAYLYLRYAPPTGAPLEFWAGFRPAASLNLKRGLIGIVPAGAPA